MPSVRRAGASSGPISRSPRRARSRAALTSLTRGGVDDERQQPPRDRESDHDHREADDQPIDERELVAEEFAELADDDGVGGRSDEGADAAETGGVGDTETHRELEVGRPCRGVGRSVAVVRRGRRRLSIAAVAAVDVPHLADFARESDGDWNHHRRRRRVRDDHGEQRRRDHHREHESSR
jgi:hypothetical protein